MKNIRWEFMYHLSLILFPFKGRSFDGHFFIFAFDNLWHEFLYIQFLCNLCEQRGLNQIERN